MKIYDPLDATASLTIENGGKFEFEADSHLWAWNGVRVKSGGLMKVLPPPSGTTPADTYLHGELHVNGGTVNVGDASGLAHLFLTDSYQMRLTGGSLVFSADKSHATNCSYIAANDIVMAEEGQTTVAMDLFGQGSGARNYDVLYGLVIYQGGEYGDLIPQGGWNEDTVSAGSGQAYRMYKEV